jgi:hypothetical protein
MATLTKTRQIVLKKISGKKFKEKFYNEPFDVMGADGELFDISSINIRTYSNSSYDIGDIFA